jgi:hypothetical protein
MATNTSISLVNLDFDTLKATLKTYLKSQTLFQDYDFDGSNMSVLLDILSYNSYLNTFYLNMVASEMFIDSAQLRNSVISIAKALNYTPKSAKSSKALLNLSFPQSGLQSFEIPEGTRFTGKNSNNSYTFTTNESVTLYPSNGAFTVSNFEVFEGVLSQDTFVYDTSREKQRFILSNESIDTDSILVAIIEDNGLSTIPYIKATSLFGLTSNSQNYFVQATEDTRYEIVFGDGIFGRKPKDGATIICNYRITSGNTGNKCTNFTLDDNLGAFNGYGSAILPTITVAATSFGGAEAESIEEIRYRAPRNFQTQERAITVNDFSTLIIQEFQNIKNVYVYGGELSFDAPKFGTVLIVPITNTGVLLSRAEQNDIETFLRQRTTIGIAPSVINPDYLFVILETAVKFNPDKTSFSSTDIKSLVENAIKTFNSDELMDFNTELNLSKLEGIINNVNESIVGNQTELFIRKIFRTELQQQAFPSIQFRNSIIPGTLISSEFTSLGRRYQYTDYNPNNNTLVARVIEGRSTVVNTSNIVYLKDITNPDLVTYTNAGIVDYAVGKITINSIRFSSFGDKDGLEFNAKPELNDISSKENDVITIDIQTGIRVQVRRIGR